MSSLANAVTIQHVFDVDLNKQIREILISSYHIQDILFELADNDGSLFELAHKHGKELSQKYRDNIEKCDGYEGIFK